MTPTQTKGWMELTNTSKYKPFLVEFEDIGTAIQVDVSGVGLLNFRERMSAELELEIHTLILNGLKKYSTFTGHDSSLIGYTLKLNQSKKLNRKYSVYETSVDLTIIFEKPVQNATAYQLQPTIELISSTILVEIFIFDGTC